MKKIVVSLILFGATVCAVASDLAMHLSQLRQHLSQLTIALSDSKTISINNNALGVILKNQIDSIDQVQMAFDTFKNSVQIIPQQLFFFLTNNWDAIAERKAEFPHESFELLTAEFNRFETFNEEQSENFKNAMNALAIQHSLDDLSAENKQKLKDVIVKTKQLLDSIVTLSNNELKLIEEQLKPALQRKVFEKIIVETEGSFSLLNILALWYYGIVAERTEASNIKNMATQLQQYIELLKQ